MFVLKIAFYGFLIIFSLIAAFLLVAGLFEGSSHTPVRERILMASASISALTILFFAFRYGHINQNWAAGIGFEFLAVFIFLVIMFGGLLTGKIHWQ